MDKFIKKIIFFYLFLFFVFYFLFSNSSFAAAPEELRASIDQKSKELQEINNKIKETQKNLGDVQYQSQTLNQEIKKIDSNVSHLNLSIRSSEVTVEKLKLEVDSLQYDIDDAEKEIIIKKKAIAEILQEFQQKDDETPLIIFLKNKSLTESIFEVQALTDLHGGLSVEINNLKNIKVDLADKLQETDDKKQATEIESENLKNKKLILGDVKKEKQVVLSQTKNQESLYQKLISDLEKKQAEIAVEIEKMEEDLRIAFDPSILPSKRPGVLGYPLVDLFITQEYGATAFAQRAYKTKFHNGIDFKASIGTPIMAAEEGEVIAVGNNGQVQYGRYILIKHKNNLATLYAHLSRQIVQKGSVVKKGEIIGYSGNTGYSTGPHLHFTVYWAPSVTLKSFSGAGLVPIGVTINPSDYL